MSWDVYDSLMSVYGTNEADCAVAQAKETFYLEAVDNPGYHPKCKRNGVPQRFLIERTDVPYKAKFVTFPEEEIWPGDLIEVNDLIYIIIEPPRFLDRINWAAVGRLCNINLKWQDFDGRICSSPVCLDAGVYSTTLNGTDTVQAPDKQFKLFLPYNEDTSKLYLDKRIAVDTRYDQHGKQILECYRITGMNRVAKTYGEGGHLLICELRSSTYSPEHDNVDELICDYVTPPEDDTPVVHPTCILTGRPRIRIGKSQTYSASFEDENGDAIMGINAVWTLNGDTEGVTLTDGEMSDTISLSVRKDEDLIGAVVLLTATASDGSTHASMEVEVVG